ncbi:hypothetical protein IX317_000613 [Fusobacterium sp. DD29]|uniref:hypothetical protein n=1 Tax=unclassified Fusobacterium TaxID=2648384 RepID=UPI001B8B9D59|nr:MULTISPECIES: hypothetical protein [unclassified Fusobacterium]MBR8700265.1 hypothetical protein [Fusobacterium sp. DD45]MBR8710480.1 hypothetical protein [Fusobacterium sp. DD28]MBR8748952.1 hypothetical protein [Fusobacterium sp. DD29]MBR8751070.1 hypothetical protein [Fusobacterium sp. DD26]MBR8761258.1 hypothetical protein [Fusobacterium sp. DD25]
MLLKCIFMNGNLRIFNLNQCAEIFIAEKEIKLDMLKGSDCVTSVLKSGYVLNFDEVKSQILKLIQGVE